MANEIEVQKDLPKPDITLSSVDDEDAPVEEASPEPGKKITLQKSISLEVPSLDVAEEPKRPPL